MRLLCLLSSILLLSGCSPEGESKDTGTAESPAILAEPANNRDFLPAALEILGQASERVHIIEYVMYDEPEVREIFQAIEAAVARGAQASFLADEVGNETPGLLAELEAAGVETRLDTPERTTHNKLIIADDQVLVGSTNFTGSSIRSNNEVDVLLSDPEITAYYESFFAELWEDSAHDPQVQAPANEPLVPLFNRQVLPALRQAIQEAEQEIALLMYAIAWSDTYTDSSVNELVNELIAASERGVEVRVALDNSDWINEKEINDRAIEILGAAAVQVRLTPSYPTTHAKMLLCDDVVIVSDANWSFGALEEYNSTGIRADNADFAGLYRAWFQDIWFRSEPAGE